MAHAKFTFGLCVVGLVFGAVRCQPGAPEAIPTETRAERPACDENGAGLDLAEGLCALVVADGLGRARHLAVRDNGDIYVAMRRSEDSEGGVVALRDTDGDGRADLTERFGDHYGTGLEIHNDYLYFGADDKVVRYPLGDSLVPEGALEVVIDGLPEQRAHAAKPIAFDDQGNIYVNVGGPSNACQEEARTEGSPGVDPCPQRERQASIWQFKNQPGNDQLADGHQYSLGIRNSVALAYDEATRSLYVVQHGRDQLDQFWPDLFDENANAELPAEEFLRLSDGADFLWPYCYFDQIQGKRVLAPEYGGDGKEVGRCAAAPQPVYAFPGHWGPNDLIFYKGRGANALSERYRSGAFIVFHGSWNRAPLPQRGYNVVFVPMKEGEATGDYELIADGFKGVEPLMSPRDAVYRPTGIAEGPDGSLYVSDSVTGRIWRILPDENATGSTAE